MRIPEEILSVTPTRNALWDVKKVMAQLDQPVTDAHGNTVTERFGQVVYATDNGPAPEVLRAAVSSPVR